LRYLKEKGAIMLLTPFNTYRGLKEFRSGFDILNSMLNNMESQRGSSLNAFTPSVNTREGEYAYHVEADLPGVKKEDISIDVQDNTLTISGVRKSKEEIKEEDYYKVESQYGKFERSFSLPENVDTEDIHAESKDGVLEVVIPKLKVPKDQPKKIDIK